MRRVKLEFVLTEEQLLDFDPYHGCHGTFELYSIF